MSWIKENYHIAALGGGALVLVGLGYLGYSGNEAVNEAFNAPNPPKKTDTTSQGGPLAEEVTALVTRPDPVIQRATPEERPVELFTSVNLYTKDGNLDKLLDLLKIDPVHPPITNQWWVDHRIDPSYSDSPTMDEDGDGYTNAEEAKAGTDPNDAKSIGDLIEKLEVVKVESDTWRLLFKQVISTGYQFDFDFIPFGKRKVSNRIPADSTIKINDVFFPTEPGKDRFKLLEVVARPFVGPVGNQMRNWAIVEDQLPSKNKARYELPFNANVAQLKAITFYDHRITLRLNAIGEEGNQFVVEENSSFSLPSGGEDKSYKMVEVKLDANSEPIAVVVEDKDGRKVEISVPAK
ncbi:MAG: hypothetical protein ACJAVK_002020 [Akkermansiaceae bacterium]|jgi:hypothetical protein